jgi:hypothetical protein
MSDPLVIAFPDAQKARGKIAIEGAVIAVREANGPVEPTFKTRARSGSIRVVGDVPPSGHRECVDRPRRD